MRAVKAGFEHLSLDQKRVLELAYFQGFSQSEIASQRNPVSQDVAPLVSHDCGSKTAWRLFNAATFSLAGKVAERPAITRDLHQIIDGACEVLH